MTSLFLKGFDPSKLPDLSILNINSTNSGSSNQNRCVQYMIPCRCSVDSSTAMVEHYLKNDFWDIASPFDVFSKALTKTIIHRF